MKTITRPRCAESWDKGEQMETVDVIIISLIIVLAYVLGMFTGKTINKEEKKNDRT